METTESREPVFALKALTLENCPFYTRGDTLQVQLPGLYSHRTHACMMPATSFMPIAMEGPGEEGRFQSGFKNCSCRWAYQKVNELNQGALELESMLTAESQLTLSFLEQLPAPISRAVRERSQVLRFQNAVNILEGQVTGSHFFVLLAGLARVTTQGEDGRVLELSVLRKGDCFGEMSLLTGAATSNRIEAMEECLVLAVPRHDFHRLLSEYPLLSIVLYRLLSKRIRASNLRLTQLLTPGISGDLSLFSLADVVQSILVARMTGTLHVSGSDREAIFGFKEGRLVYSAFGNVMGPDALYYAFQLKSGHFHFNGHEPPVLENIEGDTMGIILDTLRRLDESTMMERGAVVGEG